MLNLFRLAAVCLPLAFCAGTSAQHHGDILLDRSATAIRTNQFDLDGNETPNVRVFRVTLGAAAPNFTDTPGFDSVPGMFPYPSSNGFRIRKALRLWDGSRFKHITDPIPETIGISFGTAGPVSTPLCDGIVPGFTLQVGTNGEWHKHLEYTLADLGTPGVYLLELEIYSTNSSVGQTKPFWLVILQPIEPGLPTTDELASQDAAVAWVSTHRVTQLCPADFNGDGTLAVQDIFDFINAWFAADLDADFGGDCQLEVSDIFDYLNAWFAGCPPMGP